MRANNRVKIGFHLAEINVGCEAPFLFEYVSEPEPNKRPKGNLGDFKDKRPEPGSW